MTREDKTQSSAVFKRCQQRPSLPVSRKTYRKDILKMQYNRGGKRCSRTSAGCLVFLVATVALMSNQADAWITPSRQTALPRSSATKLYEGPLDFLKDPYKSKIPEELKDEIFKAEANTAAAKDRGQRVAFLAAIAFTGILCAFFNGFLSELRADIADQPSVDLADTPFAWVQGNFLTSFLFLNKIGGGICLLGGGGAGLLAEAELDSKRLNAEKIYEELEKRREGKTKKAAKANPSRKAKRRGGKETKRLAALSEVIRPNPVEMTSEKAAVESVAKEEAVEETVPKEAEKKEKGKGLFGSMKGFYEQADSMAASQALLLNKNLEDSGVLEKITDESGLKVIGKEDAAKLKQEKEAQGSDSEKDV